MTTATSEARSARNTRGLRDRLTAPRDPSSLAAFRIGLGLVLTWDCWRKFQSGELRRGYVLPDDHLTYWLFQWVRPHHGAGIYIAFLITGIAALMVAVGYRYRIAAVVLWAGYSYAFLIDKAQYLNHHYLAIVITFVMIFVPANAVWSLDASRRQREAVPTIPAWPVYLLRFQVAIPYFFAGIAKLNYDWVVRGEPLRFWLSNRTDFPLVGSLFVHEPVVRVMVIGSLLIDLVGPFFLLYRRTRVPMFGFALAFHFMNSRLFDIGMFPWLMIVATTIFFEPDWPRRMLDVLRGGSSRRRTAILVAFGVGALIGAFLPPTVVLFKALIGGFGTAFLAFHIVTRRDAVVPTVASVPHALSRPLVAFLAVWALIQLGVPLRPYLIPGDSHWTGEGTRYSWHMMLDRVATRYRFIIRDNDTRERWIEDVSGHLEPGQWEKSVYPDMILQTAQLMGDYYREQGRDVSVSVHAMRSLNVRPRQLLIDPTVDLTKIERPYIPPADWIVPLEPFHGGSGG